MKSKLLTGALAVVLALLCACTSAGGASSSAAVAANTTVPSAPAQAPAQPAVPDGAWSDEDAARAERELAEDPEAFGAVMASYRAQSGADISVPEGWAPGFVGRLLQVKDLVENATATQDGDKMLVVYEQQTNVQAKLLDKETGILMDAMLLLPEAQVPESLASFDYLVTLRAFPNTAFEYQGGMPAIKWSVGVYVTDIKSGQTGEPLWFEGTSPPTAFTTTAELNYNDGSFPLKEAVDYVVDLSQQGLDYEPMTVTSSGIVDGVIADEYGMRGTEKAGDMPTRSLPVSIHNAPYGTVCYALLMTDPDAVAVAGHEWLHWSVVNLERTELAASASRSIGDFTQGTNDFGAPGYGGPTPPDKPHTYVITVYALQYRVNLGEGFTREEFDEAIEGKVLAQAQVTGTYDN